MKKSLAVLSILAICILTFSGCGAPREEWEAVIAACETTWQTESFSYTYESWAEDAEGERYLTIAEESGICHPLEEPEEGIALHSNLHPDRMFTLYGEEDRASLFSQCKTETLEDGLIRYEFTMTDISQRKTIQPFIDALAAQQEQEEDEGMRDAIGLNIDRLKNREQKTYVSFTVDAGGRVIRYESKIDIWEYKEYVGATDTTIVLAYT